MAETKNIIKNKDIKSILHIVEVLFAHLEPICITTWVGLLIRGNSIDSWLDLAIHERGERRQSLVGDNLFYWYAITGGALFALGIIFRLFPVVNESSGYLKISGLIMILTSIIYVIAQNPIDINKIKYKGIYIVKLSIVVVLLISSGFSLQYY